MSEIQSISQSNYILHNIDAKKLYVQEPLFTANSGDAVYVGWRPDETVLWEGTCTSGQSATLSENIGNFEQINVYAYSHNGSPYRGIIQFDTDGNNQIYGACNATWKTNAEYSILMATCSGNKVKAMGSVIIYNGSNLGRGETIYKVIGINRKENA